MVKLFIKGGVFLMSLVFLGWRKLMIILMVGLLLDVGIVCIS